MPAPEPVEFALQGEINGHPISPTHVTFGLMRSFHEEVERLVLGSNQGSLADTVVQVREGSYGLVVPIPENVRESFERDMVLAAEPTASVAPDPERFSILTKWQKRAAFERNLTYFIRPQSERARFRTLRVDAQTQLRRPQDDRWIPVELMLLGHVLEAGGQKTNIHVRLRDRAQPVIVGVEWRQLEQEQFPFSGEKLLRVSAERNERTQALRKLRLLEFVSYRPEFDEAAFARMTAAGAKAWQDVPDATTWVREQRGGGNA